jgi:hypothetical protein
MFYQEFVEWVEDAHFITVEGHLCQVATKEESLMFIELDVDMNDIVLENDEDFEAFCHLVVHKDSDITLKKGQYAIVRNGINGKESLVTRYFAEWY